MAKSPAKTTPDPEIVRQRAYEIWQSEGCPEGAGDRHWLMAEAEIGAAKPRKPAAPRKPRTAAPKEPKAPKAQGAEVVELDVSANRGDGSPVEGGAMVTPITAKRRGKPG